LFVVRAARDFFESLGFAGTGVVGFEAAVKAFYILDGVAAFLLLA
jgi:hypothetical protein